MPHTSQSTPRAFPVSVKGVVVRDGCVLLLRNERAEWELPGGRLEAGESPEECVVREITEETQWPTTVGPILDTWMYYIALGEGHVFIVTYGCHPATKSVPVLSHEHNGIGLFTERQVALLPMPEGYKRSITTWYRHLRSADVSTTG